MQIRIRVASNRPSLTKARQYYICKSWPGYLTDILSNPSEPYIAPSQLQMTEAYLLNDSFLFTVFDSAAKIPVGVLAGNQYHLGHYDECVEISVDVGERLGGTLKGQYCLAEIQINSSFSSRTDPYTLNYDPRTSAWEKITVRTKESLSLPLAHLMDLFIQGKYIL